MDQIMITDRAWQEDCPEEYRFGMNGTAWRIFVCTVHLFAEYDYSSISMRQIADAVGIKAASIYNHFDSKEALLTKMFEYLVHYATAFKPDLDVFLSHVDTADPRELLVSTHYYYPDALYPIMSRLILITYKQMRTDSRADTIIRRMLVTEPSHYARSLLERMVAVGRIRPLDIEAFVELFANNYYGAALRMYSSHPTDNAIWVRAFQMLFNIIEPVE